MAIVTKLLAACKDEEAKYIVRSLEGKLRIGNAERTVLVALAHAAVLAEQEQCKCQSFLKPHLFIFISSRKEMEYRKVSVTVGRRGECSQVGLQVRSLHSNRNFYAHTCAVSELPNYDAVIPALLTVGVNKLREECKLTPGVPLKPMLAKPTKAIGEVLDRFEGKRFTCEYKYDGERAQVHKLPDGTVGVFSRNSEDMSKKYPDLVEQLPHVGPLSLAWMDVFLTMMQCIKENTKSFVLDAEAVAIDRTTGRLMPFQELSKRKRKDVKVEDIQIRVCLFAFDLLYLNGEVSLSIVCFSMWDIDWPCAAIVAQKLD